MRVTTALSLSLSPPVGEFSSGGENNAREKSMEWPKIPVRFSNICGNHGSVITFEDFLNNVSLLSQLLIESIISILIAIYFLQDFLYWVRLKGSYMVARIFFLLLLNCSAWPCLGPA